MGATVDRSVPEFFDTFRQILSYMLTNYLTIVVSQLVQIRGLSLYKLVKIYYALRKFMQYVSVVWSCVDRPCKLDSWAFCFLNAI